MKPSSSASSGSPVLDAHAEPRGHARDVVAARAHSGGVEPCVARAHDRLLHIEVAFAVLVPVREPAVTDIHAARARESVETVLRSDAGLERRHGHGNLEGGSRRVVAEIGPREKRKSGIITQLVAYRSVVM